MSSCQIVNCVHSNETVLPQKLGHLTSKYSFLLCKYHTAFFEGLDEINTDLLSFCTCAPNGQVMIYQHNLCHKCQKNSIVTNDENLEILFNACKDLQSSEKCAFS